MCKTILIAEDHEKISELFTAIFSESEYRILYAKDGEETLIMINDQKPDLVLLDVRLPKVDGFEICNTIKKDRTLMQTKIIILSSQVQEFDFMEANRVRADVFMVKPFKPTELL